MLIKTYRFRLYFLYLVPLIAMVGLMLRLYYLQIIQFDYWKKLADEQHYKNIGMIPMRGKIYDSNGHELAGSVILDAAYMELKRLPDASGEMLPEMASQLSKIVGVNHDKILQQLQGKYNLSPMLARNLTDKQKVEIRGVLHQYQGRGVPQNLIEFKPENKRKYTRGDLAPHVVGFTQRDVEGETGDNKGAAGVERFYDTELKGKKESYTTRQTATGNPMEPADPSLLEGTFGQSVRLTINETLQETTQNVLAQGVEKSKADSGVAVCYHVKTGEILALANYPQFDLNNIAATTSTQTRNRAVADPIEPGSVMKIITFTSLFSDNKMEPTDYINCEGGTWRIPGINRLITDSHRSGSVPVSEVFQHSSNIGTIKAAQKFDRESFYDHITKFGFGARTGVDLPGESSGTLRHHKLWDSWSMSSLPMGYEMQVTAVQVVTAVGAIANKGIMMKPHVVKEVLDHDGNTVREMEPEVVRQVATPSACRKIINLMELVVEKGTGKAGKVEGYRVGGKTGTTKKVGKNGLYEDAYIAGFCGIAPIEDPEVCIYVYIDNPKGGKFYGGLVAGPVFREIAREAMKVLRIPENRPVMPADDFRQTLDKVREELDGEFPAEFVKEFDSVSEDEEISTGIVPDFRGKTLAEAVKLGASVGMEVKVTGSGVVVDQDPAHHETIEDKAVVSLTLMNSRQYLRQRVEEYDSIMGQPTEVAEAAEPKLEVELSTVTLSLRTGDSAVPLKVQSAPTLPWSEATGAAAAPRKTLAERTPYPDLDEYAQQPVDQRTARKTWENLEKELEAMPKQAKEVPSKGPSEESLVVNESSAVPTDRPIPDIDGSGEMDVSANSEQPVEIVVPKKTPRPAPARDPNEISLYNL